MNILKKYGKPLTRRKFMKIIVKKITGSNIGVQLVCHENLSSLAELAHEILSNVNEKGLVLVKNLSLTRDNFKELVNLLGTTTENKYLSGSSELLDLNSDPDPEKSVTGSVALPLHTDGLLVRTRPKYTILYCNEFNQDEGYGETEICGQKLAFENMPKHLKEMFQKDWEYQAKDMSHFQLLADEWLSISPFIKNNDGTTSMNLALPFDSKEKSPAWSVRLSGKDEQSSRVYLLELDQFLKNCEAFYSHRWSPSDLLIINNYKVLHGRNEVTKNGIRHLFRGQINEH